MAPPLTQTFLTGLECLRCGQFYLPESVDYVCRCRPNRGSDLGHLDVVYDYEAVVSMRKGREVDLERANLDRTDSRIGTDAPWPDTTTRSIERWWPLLPVRPDSLPPLPVGDTPLLRANRLAGAIGLKNLFIKDDARNPSGSFKDRASAIAVARARETGREVIATASTGNAAAALAAMGAAAGHATIIFVPRSAPQAKIAQLLVYGSRVLAVDGSYDDAFDLCVRACESFGWYNRNTGYNPFMTEGKKTVSFEIAAQLSEMRSFGGEIDPKRHGPQFDSPDSVFVSVGDGSIIGGVYKGFRELHQLGWIDCIPRIFGVQSTDSAAIHNAWRDGLDLPLPVKATTAADSISVNSPRDAVKASASSKGKRWSLCDSRGRGNPPGDPSAGTTWGRFRRAGRCNRPCRPAGGPTPGSHSGRRNSCRNKHWQRPKGRSCGHARCRGAYCHSSHIESRGGESERVRCSWVEMLVSHPASPHNLFQIFQFS